MPLGISALTLLRAYPRGFGVAISRLMPKLSTCGEGMPEVPHLDKHLAASEFGQLSWSDWEEADLGEVVFYARGNRALNVPDYWRSAFPKGLPSKKWG